MLHVLQRIGFLRRRGIIPMILIGLIAAGVALVRSLNANVAPLELVLTPLEAEVRAGRLPVLVGVRNSGLNAMRPARLEILVPARIRLRPAEAGAPIRATRVEDAPLMRYIIDADFPAIPPDTTAVRVPGVDTLWVERADRAVRCLAGGDSMPTFKPTPPLSSADATELPVFYAFSGGDLDQRGSGWLSLRLPPGPAEPSAQLAYGPVRLGDPDSILPRIAGLRLVGVTWAECGPPEDPQRLASTVWRAPGGGRVIALGYDGVARKYLFDLDADSVIELEVWDANGDGRFEARRQARIPLFAEFLPPVAPRPAPRLAAPDTLRPDTSVRLGMDTLRPPPATPGTPLPAGTPPPVQPAPQ
ncbi:MAG: hypothetical protein ACRELD_14560, partial [Longimicrobiales bacterium]